MPLGALDYSALQMAYAIESTFGTAPGGNYKVLNLSDENIKGNPTKQRSGTAKSNRLKGKRKRLAVDGGGPINFNMLFGTQFEDMLGLALCSTWSTPLAISSTAISFVASDNSINGTGLFGSVTVGQVIKIGGAATGGNNGFALVVSATADKVVVAWLTITDEAAGATVTVTGSVISKGATKRSATFQRRHTDASTKPYQIITGNRLNTLGLRFNFREFITATAEFMGLMPGPRTATPAASGYTTEDLGEDLDVSNNMKLFRYDGAISGNVRGVELNWANNMEYVPVAQTPSPDDISLGDIDLTGRFSAYVLDGAAFLDDAYDDTEVALTWSVQPATGGAYFFHIPVLTFNEVGDQGKSAARGPCMVDLNWEAEEDSAGQILYVSKHAA
jgi:hypothetical protein